MHDTIVGMMDFGNIVLESPWRLIRIQIKDSVAILAHFDC